MARRSSQEIAFRPLTCAQPVIPGLTSWRRAWVGVVPIHVLHQKRPRPHQAHVTLEHVEQLRQFVETERSEQSSCAAEAIAVGRDHGRSSDLSHRSKLQDRERAAIETRSPLTEQDRGAEPATNREGNNRDEREQENESTRTDSEIQQPLD